MIKYSKEKITVPYNEFMKIFFVCTSDIEYIKENKKFPFRATIKIDTDINVLFLVKEDYITKSLKEKSEEIKKVEPVDRFNYIIANIIKPKIIFERQSYLLYCILFDYFSNNQDKLDNGYLIISFKEIHQLYRNKTLKHFGAIDSNTLESYKNGLEDLHEKEIFISLQKSQNNEKEKSKKYIKEFNKPCINQNLIDYEFVKNDKDQIVSVKYRLGDFGKLMLESGRMASNIPIELIRLPYKEINKFYLGMYIGKLIFINKRTSVSKSVSVKCILNNIMSFNIDGTKKGITKCEEIKTAIQKTKLISKFEEQLRAVLKEFKTKEIVKEFEINVDKITAKNFDKENSKITIFFK